MNKSPDIVSATALFEGGDLFLLGTLAALVVLLILTHRSRRLLQQDLLPLQQDVESSRRESSQILDFLEHTTDAFFQTDHSYHIQYANDKAAEVLNLQRNHLIGSVLWDQFPEAVSETFFHQFRQSRETQAAVEFETWFAPGKSWFVVHAYPTDNTFFIYFRDITDRKKAELGLKESENRYRELFDSLGDGAFVYRDDTLLDVNTVACQNLGYSREQLLKLTLRDIDTLLSGPGGDLMLTQLKRTGSASFETEHVRNDGSRQPVWINARQIDYQGETAVLAIARDMTDRRNQDLQLEQLATTDPLTNAFNRRYFMVNARSMTKGSRRGGKPFSIMMMDLDFFKKVNDTYGHEFGDRALIHFSEICRKDLRRQDLFCRMGGEEFAALLPDVDLATSHKIADRLRQSLQQTPLRAENGEEVHLTVSIGLVNSQHLVDLNHNRLLALADQALYAAKHGGRNRVCAHPPPAEHTEPQPELA